MLSEANIASLSANVGSSLLGTYDEIFVNDEVSQYLIQDHGIYYTFADKIQHISHKLTLTALKSALLNGEP